jgi:hypothetical protein
VSNPGKKKKEFFQINEKKNLIKIKKAYVELLLNLPFKKPRLSFSFILIKSYKCVSNKRINVKVIEPRKLIREVILISTVY